MDFGKFILTKDTYTFGHLHPIFMYKCVLAIMYWLQCEEIDYEKQDENGDVVIKVQNGITFTTEDIGKAICVDYGYCYPKKVDFYRCESPLMLCSADDDLDETYLSRFAPGLYSLIESYKKLNGFEKYVVCSEEVMIMLNKWVTLDQTPKRQIDVLFLVGSYNTREVSDNVAFGKELVIFEYEVKPSESLRLTKADIVITIIDDVVVVNGVERTI